MNPPPAAILLAACAALALPACGGDVEKEALRTYEATIEKPMEQDAKIGERLRDLREDLLTSNTSAEEMLAYSQAEATPFYGRLKDVAAKAPASGERLKAVHAVLESYVEHRLGYLAAIDGFLDIHKGEGMQKLRRTQEAWDAAVQELNEKTNGRIADAGMADAINRRTAFMKQKYEAFQTGKITVEEVEESLRGEVIPSLQKVAERTQANRTAEGSPGAVARWAAAELAFFQELAANLPIQSRIQKLAVTSQKEWDTSVEKRAEFIDAIRKYRESLR